MTDDSARTLRSKLEQGAAAPADVVGVLAVAALEAPTRAARLDACELLGDLAGRALGADWEVAERAAFALLEAARVADTAADRRGVIQAMGRGFRNLWLLPFVHRRLSDRDETIAAAALHAAGGLGFPALEEAVAAYVGENVPAGLRRAAIGALGRMGAASSVDRLVAVALHDADEAESALAALTEIRSPAARAAVLEALAGDLEPEVQIAAVRYLAELGALEVLPVLRRLARSDLAEIRIAAGLASRALKAERERDPTERFLVALGEPDRAVRAQLARRLRTIPVAQILEQAEVLLSDDAAGVIQVLGEVREPEITRYLLALAGRSDLPAEIRARAIGTIEADQEWERGELVKLAMADGDEQIRASAVQAMGAFATASELVDHFATLAASSSGAIRGALLWALQLARRAPNRTDADRIATLVGPMLNDPDPMVRRRAGYVAGNLGLDKLAPALVVLCSADTAELRLAGYVALGELGMPGVISEVVAAVKREDDPRVLGAASNALIASMPEPNVLLGLAGKASQLLTAPDARSREAGAEIAGLLGGAVPAAQLVALATDDASRVRGAAVWALGKLADPSTEAAMLAAFRDDDATVHERAAAGLLRLGTPDALAQAIAFVAGDGDPATRGAIAAAIHIPPAHAERLSAVIDDALSKTDADDDAFEALIQLKLATAGGVAAPTIDVDGEITTVFPSFAQLTKLAGFDALVKSLRTAESLFHSTANQQDADLSPPITLWMKVLENYVHAWLGPRLAGLQRDPASLYDYVDRVIGGSWGGFSRWLEPKWRDPAEVGGARVEIPLRAVPNAVRDLTEHRRKRLDSPLSVTEWARMLVLFAVDHPQSGFRNLFKLSTKSSERTVALAHRLHTLAAVRNLVTHRSSAGAATVAAFRRTYYGAFEDLVALA
ncbi:MAG: HEAT repeat domain-containing protein [Kofleriaceae bacterium]